MRRCGGVSAVRVERPVAHPHLRPANTLFGPGNVMFRHYPLAPVEGANRRRAAAASVFRAGARCRPGAGLEVPSWSR
jgi:hypothetical protein